MQHADFVGADVLRELGVDGGGDLADALEILCEAIGFELDLRRQRLAVERHHRRAQKVLAHDFQRDRPLALQHHPRRDVVDLRRGAISFGPRDRIPEIPRITELDRFAFFEDHLDSACFGDVRKRVALD